MDNVAGSLCRLEYGGSEAYGPRRYAECFCGHIQREEADVRPERVDTGLVQGGSETWRCQPPGHHRRLGM